MVFEVGYINDIKTIHKIQDEIVLLNIHFSKRCFQMFFYTLWLFIPLFNGVLSTIIQSIKFNLLLKISDIAFTNKI